MPILESPVGRVYNNSEEQPSEFDMEKALSDTEKWLKDLARYVEDLHGAYDGSATRKKILDLVAQSRRAYYTEPETTNFPWDEASNMITPLTTMGVDELEPRLVSAVIGREPYIKAIHTKQTSKEEAQAVTDFDNYILDHKIKVKELVPAMIHEQLLDGTIYPLLSWDTEEKQIRRWGINQETGMPEKQDGISVREKPTVTLVPVEFVWHADDIDDEEWEEKPVIRYIGELTVGEIQRRAEKEEGWHIPEDLSKYNTSTKTHKTYQQESEETGDYNWVYEESFRPLEFYEAYLNYPGLDGNEEKWIVLLEVSSFDVFRIRPQIDTNDENIKPLRRMRFLKRKGISWGYPLYTLIAGIQLGMDAMWNRCVNSADITMTPWGFIKRNASGLRDSAIEVYPGNLIEIDNPEAVNFPNLSAFQPAQFVPLIMQYVSFFERTLNVSDFIQGRESQLTGKKGSTATGTLAILQEGKVKFEYRGGLIHNEYLRFFLDIHDLCVTHMPFEEMVKICGQPIINYSSSEDFQFLLVGSDLTSNRFVDRQETESLMASIGPFMELLNPMTVVSDLLISYNKPPEDYINPELMQLVMQWLTVQRNTKAIAAMGIPPEIAAQLAQQGATPETVGEFAKQLGKEVGKAQFAPPEEKEEKGENAS